MLYCMQRRSMSKDTAVYPQKDTLLCPRHKTNKCLCQFVLQGHFLFLLLFPLRWCLWTPNWLYYWVFDYSIYCIFLTLFAITTLILATIFLCVFSLIGEYIFVFFLEYLSLSFDNKPAYKCPKTLGNKGLSDISAICKNTAATLLQHVGINLQKR